MPFSQSELVRLERLLSSVALALIAGYVPYKHFSSAGRGALLGVAEGHHDLRKVLLKQRPIGGASVGSRGTTASVSVTIDTVRHVG